MPEDPEAAAKLLSEASERAQLVIEKAEKVAAALVAVTPQNDEKVTKALSDALRDVFGDHVASGRFIDVSRIPLICKSIIDTSAQLKEISERLDNKYVTNEVFNPVKTLVYGFVGMALVAIVGAMLYLVIASPGKTIIVPAAQVNQTIK